MSSSSSWRWQDFYNQTFGLNLRLDQVSVPAKSPGFRNPAFIAPFLSLEWLVQVLTMVFGKKQLVCHVEPNDWAGFHDRRFVGVQPTGGAYPIYGIRVRSLRSDNLGERRRVCAMTLKEFIILVLYYRMTGKELPSQTPWLLVRGSRHNDGRIPMVKFQGGRIHLSVTKDKKKLAILGEIKALVC